MQNRQLSNGEALALVSLSGDAVFGIFEAASRVRGHFRGDSVDVCSIVNARSGACPEDCAYCAQSARNSAKVDIFPLLDEGRILEKAKEAKKGGAGRFCIVTSGRRVSGQDLKKIGSVISKIRGEGLLPCATLGLLSGEELRFLMDSGLERYHNNLETSERFFPEICSTHTYRDKMKTIDAVKKAGLSLCSGGIFGLGETWQDRVDMAFALREISPDSVPINFLIPIEGTPMESRRPLLPLEALKVISLYRLILPAKEIRVCGGRMQVLGDLHSFIFFAGADGLLSGNYLTTLGRDFDDDLRFIRDFGLGVRPTGKKCSA